MSHESLPTDARLREELVAYLDGELTAEDEAAVESRISGDQDCRAEMQRLERAWNALDVLPRSTVGDGFTQTTIEIAAVEAKREVTQQTAMLPARRRSRRMKWVAIAAAASLAGFVVSRFVAPDPNRTLYANLPLIAEYDAYNQQLDLDLLRKLPKALPQEFGAGGDPQIAKRVDTLNLLTNTSYQDRSAYVRNLPVEEKYDLAAKTRRFEAMGSERREELAMVHDAIAGETDPLQLWQAMLVYSEFVSQLPAAEQANLRSMPTDERLARITELASRDQWRSDFALSASNAEALREALPKLLADKQLQAEYDALLTTFDERSRNFLEELAKRTPPGREKFVILMSARANQSEATPEFKQYAGLLESHLMAALDEAARSRLDSLSFERRGQILLWWLADAHTRISAEDQESFFASSRITDAQRQRLLAMPKDEMQRELKELYAETYLAEDQPGGFLPRGFWNRGRRGRMGRGRGPGPEAGELDGRRSPGPPSEGEFRGNRTPGAADGPPPQFDGRGEGRGERGRPDGPPPPPRDE